MKYGIKYKLMRKILRKITLLLMVLVSMPVIADVVEVNSIAELKARAGGSIVKYNLAERTQVAAFTKTYSGDILFLWDGTDGVCVYGIAGGEFTTQVGAAKVGQMVSGTITGTYSGTKGFVNTLTCTPGTNNPDHAVSLTLGEEGTITPVTVTVDDLLKEQATMKYVNSIIKVHGVPSYYNYANVFFDETFSKSLTLSNDYNFIDYSALNDYNNQLGYFTGIFYSTISYYNTSFGLNIINTVWFASEGPAPAAAVSYDALTKNTIESKPLADVTLNNLTLTAGEYNTLCLPFAATKEAVYALMGEGTKVYTLDRNNCSILEGVANYAFKPYDLASFNEISAGIPVIIVPEKTVSTPVFDGVSITSASPGSDSFTDWGNYAQLKVYGTFNPYTADATTNRVLNAQGAAVIPGGEPLNAFTAYLVLPAFVTDAANPEVNITIDGVTAGINELSNTTSAKANDNNAIYDLSGRQLTTNKAALKAGIYIINGKKVWIKQ